MSGSNDQLRSFAASTQSTGARGIKALDQDQIDAAKKAAASSNILSSGGVTTRMVANSRGPAVQQSYKMVAGRGGMATAVKLGGN